MDFSTTGLRIFFENPVPEYPRRGCLEVAAVRQDDNQDAPHEAPTSRAPCSDVLRFAGTIRRPASQRLEGRSFHSDRAHGLRARIVARP